MKNFKKIVVCFFAAVVFGVLEFCLSLRFKKDGNKHQF